MTSYKILRELNAAIGVIYEGTRVLNRIVEGIHENLYLKNELKNLITEHGLHQVTVCLAELSNELEEKNETEIGSEGLPKG